MTNPVIKRKARNVRFSNRAIPVNGEGKERQEPPHHTFGKGKNEPGSTPTIYKSIKAQARCQKYSRKTEGSIQMCVEIGPGMCLGGIPYS